jgi:hypothetical protein
MLASLTATIANPIDGNNEKLDAVVTNTPIKATYSNNVLTLSGVAGIDIYQQVLTSITYGNMAQSPREDDRNIEIVVNDGVADSAPVVTKIKYEPATQQAALDSVLQLNGNWLSGN